MNVHNLIMPVIENYLKNHDSISSVIEEIKSKANEGQIVFYPCGKYANILVREIQKSEPALYSKIFAFLDKSSKAKSETNVPVLNISTLPEIEKNISLLVIAQNYFYDRDIEDVLSINAFIGKIIKTSYFDISLPEKDFSYILADINKVYQMLADKKSRIVYLMTWLSRALNDESITYLFEGEEEWTLNSEETHYKGYILRGLESTIVKELYSEIYKMRHFSPQVGDTVLDIGAFKGDTAFFFARHVGEKGKVYSFEPTQKNFDALKKNIAFNNLNNIVQPVNKGVSNHSATMRAVSFESGASFSFISEMVGDEIVDVTTIDQFIEENKISKVDLIKMDVEGFETNVLQGATDTIKRFSPKLAVPLYHKTSDLTEIPLLITKLGNYKFYIRCKMEGPFAVNLYCIPT